jgi:hypothetical protein
MTKIATLNQYNFNKAIGKGLFEDIKYIFEKECLIVDEYGRIYNDYYMHIQSAFGAFNWCILELQSLYEFHNIVER